MPTFVFLPKAATPPDSIFAEATGRTYRGRAAASRKLAPAATAAAPSTIILVLLVSDMVSIVQANAPNASHYRSLSHTGFSRGNQNTLQLEHQVVQIGKLQSVFLWRKFLIT